MTLDLMEDWLQRTGRGINPELAEDLIQEGRIMLWREYGDYHEHAAKRPLRLRMLDLASGKRPWTGEDRTRRLGRAKEYATKVLPEKPVHMEPDIERRVMVQEAMSRLTPNERRFIYGRFYLQLSWDELEQQYGYHPSPVWRTARDKLRTQLIDLREAS